MDVSLEIALILFKRSQTDEKKIEFDELKDPGGKIVALLDQCNFCLGTTEAWEGFVKCKWCEGGFRRLGSDPASTK